MATLLELPSNGSHKAEEDFATSSEALRQGYHHTMTLRYDKSLAVELCGGLCNAIETRLSANPYRIESRKARARVAHAF
jgi:hypothetical protein